MTYARSAVRGTVSLISLLLIAGLLSPTTARAGVVADFWSFMLGGDAQAESLNIGNLQTLPLTRPAMNLAPSPGRGGGGITIVDGSALLPQEGPSGTIADIEKPQVATISTYVVRPGDTVSSIAKLFGVSANTVLWANDLSRNSTLQVGQTLTILPVTGIRYTVQKGDTLSSIAKHYGGDPDEISRFNEINPAGLSVGDTLIIPNGEASAPPHAGGASSSRGVREPAHDVGPAGSPSEIAYYIAPLSHYVETQGIHGYNAVDLAAPSGTPVVASAEGSVVVAKEGGWNGGYGSYVVLQHGNGSQTLYAHLSRVIAYDGQRVVQGQVIGYVGATGLATGPHVHFEIRNGIRNPF